MTVETVSPDTDDLAAFEKLFSGKTAPESAPEPVEEDIQEELETPAPSPTEDEDTELVDNPEEDTTKLKIERPKLTARERIEQLNTKFREEERARQAEHARSLDLERQLRELSEKVNTPKPEAIAKGPAPDEVDAEGNSKYPLGEFDPAFVSDLADFRVEQRLKAFQAEQQELQVKAREEAERAVIEREWISRLNEAEATLPDLRTKAATLEPVIGSLDPQYGEYIAATIMSLDNGPDVLYYLSDNPAEAQRIFSSGATHATIALGRLDAMVKTPSETKTTKVTEAPEPPPVRSRGTSGKFSVAPDTDDLDAFSAEFFVQKKRGL